MSAPSSHLVNWSSCCSTMEESTLLTFEKRFNVKYTHCIICRQAGFCRLSYQCNLFDTGTCFIHGLPLLIKHKGDPCMKQVPVLSDGKITIKQRRSCTISMIKINVYDFFINTVSLFYFLWQCDMIRIWQNQSTDLVYELTPFSLHNM